MIRPIPTRDVIVLLGGLVAIAAVTGLLRTLPGVSPTTVALALLLVVLGTATMSRLRIAIVVSVVAMLTLNFFFLPPVGHFTIADPQNWVALLVFLVVAVVGSKLSAAAQARAHEAIARRNEVTRLFDLTRDVLLTTETAGAIDSPGPTCRPPLRAVAGGNLPACRSQLADLPGRSRRRRHRCRCAEHGHGRGQRHTRVRRPACVRRPHSWRRAERRVDCAAAASARRRLGCSRRPRPLSMSARSTRSRASSPLRSNGPSSWRTGRGRAGSPEGRSCGDTARVAEPRSQDAVDRHQGGRREPAGRPGGRRSSAAGRRGHRRVGPADAPVSGHPRHGAHRRSRHPYRPAVGRRRRRGRCRRRTRQACAAGTLLACGCRRGDGGRDRPTPRIRRPVAPARERGAVLAGRPRDPRARSCGAGRIACLRHGPGPGSRPGRARSPLRAFLPWAHRLARRHLARGWGSRSRGGCWRQPAGGSGPRMFPVVERSSLSSCQGSSGRQR